MNTRAKEQRCAHDHRPFHPSWCEWSGCLPHTKKIIIDPKNAPPTCAKPDEPYACAPATVVPGEISCAARVRDKAARSIPGRRRPPPARAWARTLPQVGWKTSRSAGAAPRDDEKIGGSARVEVSIRLGFGMRAYVCSWPGRGADTRTGEANLAPRVWRNLTKRVVGLDPIDRVCRPGSGLPAPLYVRTGPARDPFRPRHHYARSITARPDPRR
jgi:hypothetical protein